MIVMRALLTTMIGVLSKGLGCQVGHWLSLQGCNEIHDQAECTKRAQLIVNNIHSP